MTIIKNLIFEFLVIMAIMLGGLAFGSSEMKVVFSEDIGSIIISVGILWSIGAFMRMGTSSAARAFSLFISIGLCLLGYVIWGFGLLAAIFPMGIYILYCTWLASPFVSPKCLQKMAVIGFILTLIGFPLREARAPTKIIPEPLPAALSKEALEQRVIKDPSVIRRLKEFEKQEAEDSARSNAASRKML